MSYISSITRTFLLGFGMLVAGCSSPDQADTPDPLKSFECESFVANSCADIYRPVCATRDNGVRCVTTPCDSTETVTYPNDCAACADERVYFYHEGRCSTEDGSPGPQGG